MKYIYIVWLLFLSISISYATEMRCETDIETIQVIDKWRWIKVKVVYKEIEGGFYGLIAEDGSRYLPLQLDNLYQQVDLQLQVLLEELPQYKSFQMWGITANIHHVIPACKPVL